MRRANNTILTPFTVEGLFCSHGNRKDISPGSLSSLEIQATRRALRRYKALTIGRCLWLESKGSRAFEEFSGLVGGTTSALWQPYLQTWYTIGWLETTAQWTVNPYQKVREDYRKLVPRRISYSEVWKREFLSFYPRSFWRGQKRHKSQQEFFN